MKFYSEKLDKIFDTSDELVKAEQAADKAAAEKAKKAEAKKADAKRVEDAFKAHNAAKKVFNENFTKLRRAYAEDLAALKETFDKAVAIETEKLSAAEKNYTTALKEFTDKHKEGFHLTLTDGDHVMTISNKEQTSNSQPLNQNLELFNKLCSSIFGF